METETTLAEFLIKGIVTHPEAVTVRAAERDDKRVLHVQVASKDMARVMGSRGFVIRAIRTLVTSSPAGFADVIIEALPHDNLS